MKNIETTVGRHHMSEPSSAGDNHTSGNLVDVGYTQGNDSKGDGISPPIEKIEMGPNSKPSGIKAQLRRSLKALKARSTIGKLMVGAYVDLQRIVGLY